MKPINYFIEKLKQGTVCIGPGVTFTDPLVTEVLADEVDFLWYDLEHCPMSLEALSGHFLAARGCNKPAIIRVPVGEVGIVKQVLDSGANGIVVPQVKTVEEVKNLVSLCYYPPKGQRGFGPRIPSDFGRIDGNEVMKEANASIFVSVMIETVEALDNIEEIVSIDGLTSVVIGPSDLSIALGIPNELTHPKIASAIKKIVKAAKARDVFVGSGLGADKDYADFLVSLGVEWLQLGSDFAYLIQRVRQLKP